MPCYWCKGSHHASIVDANLERGWLIWYRSMVLPTNAAASSTQNNVLPSRRYDWHYLLNTTRILPVTPLPQEAA